MMVPGEGTVQGIPPMYVCDDCGKHLPSLQELIAHGKTCKPTRCKTCGDD